MTDIDLIFRCGGGGGGREVEEEKDEDCGDTPAGRLTQSLLMQTAPQRASTSRRRQDSREYRCVLLCIHEVGHDGFILS